MKLVKGTTDISLKHFDIVSVFTLILTLSLLLFFVAEQQDSAAKMLANKIEQVNKVEPNTLVFVNDLYRIEINSKEYSLRDKPWLTRQVELSATNATLLFVHLIYRLTFSPVFWLFLVVYFIGITFLRGRFKYRLDLQLTEIAKLEKWVNHSQQEGAIQPLTASNKISDYINNIQEELVFAKKGQSRFDQEIRESALLDPKTRIGNRDFFTSHLGALLREEDARGAVFLIQLKGCELVQNLYGEEQAIKLLENAIEGIKSRIMHIPDCFLSRRSEFELAALVPDLYVKEIEKLAERMLNNLISLPLPIGVNKDEFCHFGISCFKNDSKLYQIMSEADMALRSAQLQGPSQWFMYDPGEIAKESAIGSLKWRTFLTQVIEQKSFIIFSQPVIDTRQHKVLHYEVLSKVKNHRGGLISPRVFLPMAEKCGFSSQLDLMVFEQVCQLITFESQDYPYSFNLSIEAVLSESFRKKLYLLLNKYQGVAEKLIIEISEYHLKSRFSELLPIVQELRSHGFKILADKVGQYIVNAQYLNQYDISYVKLHRSIILDINIKPENQVFVQSMKVLCESLDINLYAVGVENLDEWQTLSKIGICGGQGHYFDEPIAQIANAID